ncbi:hypothetical protein C8R47DRAFT_640220 [Mycena vitilis]|nr:hypothetical protein C8R47DRAFT_640220 [Mycena vitilis]
MTSLPLSENDYNVLNYTINGYLAILRGPPGEMDPNLREETIEKLEKFLDGYHRKPPSFKHWFTRWMKDKVAIEANDDLKKAWKDYQKQSEWLADIRSSNPPPPMKSARVTIPGRSPQVSIDSYRPAGPVSSLGSRTGGGLVLGSMELSGSNVALPTPSSSSQRSQRSRRHSSAVPPMGSPAVWNDGMQTPPNGWGVPQQGMRWTHSDPTHPTQYASQQAQQQAQQLGYHNTYTGYPNYGPQYPQYPNNGNPPYWG